MANDNPWMTDPLAGGGGADINGPGGANPEAKKKKKNPYRATPGPGIGDISGPGGENPYSPKTAPGGRQITGPGSVYHGWNTPGAAEGAKQWGVWGPLTAGAGGTGGKGGSAWNFLNKMDPSQKQSVFGWLGKNYNPAQGQTGNISAAQALLKKGDYQGFLRMVGSGGGSPMATPGPGIGDISGPGGENPGYGAQINPGVFNINGPGGINPAYRQGFSANPFANIGNINGPGGENPLAVQNPYLNAFRW